MAERLRTWLGVFVKLVRLANMVNSPAQSKRQTRFAQKPVLIRQPRLLRMPAYYMETASDAGRRGSVESLEGSSTSRAVCSTMVCPARLLGSLLTYSAISQANDGSASRMKVG